MDVKLVMFKSDGARKDFDVADGLTVVGRGEDCGLRVPLLSVSRRHCELTLAGDEFRVKDLGSSNGTYVNNKRITEVVLNPGDRMVVGPVVFTVQIDGEPSDIQPAKIKTKAEPKAVAKGEEEEVELELAAAKSTPTTVDDVAAALAAGAGGEDAGEVDPISALEALAAVSKKKKEAK